MILLKIGTAVTLKMGPFVDATDGVTPETGLTISASDVLISRNGAALAAKNEASAATHDANGWYAVDLDADDTDEVGVLLISIYESGALPVWLQCTVLPAAVYDALVDGNNPLQVNVTAWASTTVATPDTAGYPKVTIKDGTGTGELDTLSGKVLLQDGAVTAAVVATGAIDADAIADSAIDAGAIATGAITAAKFAAGAIDAAAIATGAIDADALAADVINDIFQGTALTQSYATDAAAATPAQLLYMIWAMLAEKSVSGTTLTVKQLNGITTAMTFTLNDASNPTSITRAS